MIRTAKLARPPSTLPNANITRNNLTPRTAVSRQALDAFDNGPSTTGMPNIGLNLGNGPGAVVTTPTTPVGSSLTPTNNSNSTPAATSSSSSGGGFFSRLFSGILGGLKSLASSLISKATSFIDSNWGSWMSSASSFIGNLFGGASTSAKGWIDGLLGNVTNKLDS